MKSIHSSAPFPEKQSQTTFLKHRNAFYSSQPAFLHPWTTSTEDQHDRHRDTASSRPEDDKHTERLGRETERNHFPISISSSVRSAK